LNSPKTPKSRSLVRERNVKIYSIIAFNTVVGRGMCIVYLKPIQSEQQMIKLSRLSTVKNLTRLALV
jgi:hypothetical protein